MKKSMIALGLALVTATAMAQPGQGQHEGARAGGKGAGIAHMKEELGLTDEQLKEMRQIRQEGGSREEIQAVLTAEQQARAAELRQTHMATGLKRMKEHLGLSDEQVAQIKEIRQAGGSREEVRAVLTPEQQATFDEARGKHKGKGKPPRTED